MSSDNQILLIRFSFFLGKSGFIDFEPPIPEDYKDFPNFAHYIGYKFENEPYTSGSSEIGEALRRVRVYDLPSARPGIDIETSCWFQAIRLALECITISI